MIASAYTKLSAPWRPSKVAPGPNDWRASRDAREVVVGSRFTADLLVAEYEELITAHARGVLADIGCGKLPYFGIYRDLVDGCIAVDWPSSPHESTYVDVMCDLNEGIALPDACVDTVLCTDVLEHIYQPAVLWAAIARILRPGGVAIVGTPFLYPVHEAPHDYHRYTGFALERYARDAGLRPLAVRALGGLPTLMTDLVCRATQRVPLVSEATGAIARRLLRTRPVRRVADRTAASYPLAYMMTAQKDEQPDRRLP